MNNFPETDIWRLADRDPDSQNYRQNYKFDFTFFESNELKMVVKEYIWTNYSTGNRVPKGLRESLWRFKYFDAFCRQNSISALRNLTHSLVDDFRSFLRLYMSAYTGRSLSYCYQRSCFSALKTLVDWCRVFLSEAAPTKQIFTGSEYRQVDSRLKIDFIPDEILQVVNKALKSENNPYLKYGFIILECTGMRLGDLLLLTTDCISKHPISGYTISWFDHKNRKSRDNMPIPAECKQAVACLISRTDAFRGRADPVEKERLFIYAPTIGTHPKPIVTVSKQVFTKWCGEFCTKHDIRDSGGNIFRLTSHMFRRTLATDIAHKTAADMTAIYNFSEKQNSVLNELLAERDTLLELIGEVTFISTEAAEIIKNLPDDISPERKAVIKAACSLVGKVNYFWGGKSLTIGWDSRWGTLQKVTADESQTTGTYRPYGLDCSGLVDL